MLDTLSVPAVFNVNVSKDGEITVKTKIAKYKAKNKTRKLPLAIETPYGLFTVTATDNFVPGEKLKTGIVVSGYGIVAENWAKILDSYIPNKRTNIISLSVEDANIQRGKDFLNTLIDLYNRQGLEDKNIEAAKTGAFIDERLAIISKELYDIETEIEEYKVDNKILDVIEDARAAYARREQYADIQLQAEMRSHIVAIVEEFINNPENKNSLLISTSGVVGDSEIAKYNNLLITRRELLRSAKAEDFRVGEPATLQMVLQDTIRVLSYRYLGEEVKKIRNVGKFRTLKFECQLGTTEGYSFTDGSIFTIWISNDDNKIPLYIESPVRIGSINAYISGFRGLKYPLTSKIK